MKIVARRTQAAGKVLGLPATTTAEQRADIRARHKAGASISELSRLHGVSRATALFKLSGYAEGGARDDIS